MAGLQKSFSIKGMVTAVDHFQGGRLRITILADEGHKVELWQDVAVGTALVEGNVINREMEDVIAETPDVEIGHSATISVSIGGPMNI